tara:strand:+ start:26 stop:853 length:828 start_codon:yes stop_codon:yes gene_type:complete
VNNFKQLEVEFDKFFLDKKYYTTLKADSGGYTFNKKKQPGKRLSIGSSGGYHKNFENLFHEKIDELKLYEFKHFINAISDPHFHKKILNHLNPSIKEIGLFQKLKLMKPIKIHNKNDEISFFDWIFFNNCYLNFVISQYSSNFGMPIHRDHRDKITALLFYFGFSDKKLRERLGTEVYKIKKQYQSFFTKDLNTLKTDMTDNNKLIKVQEIAPYPNRLFSFMVGHSSWHGVEYIDLPKNVYRNTLQINLMKLRRYKFSKLINIYSYFRKKIIFNQ